MCKIELHFGVRRAQTHKSKPRIALRHDVSARLFFTHLQCNIAPRPTVARSGPSWSRGLSGLSDGRPPGRPSFPENYLSFPKQRAAGTFGGRSPEMSSEPEPPHSRKANRTASGRRVCAAVRSFSNPAPVFRNLCFPNINNSGCGACTRILRYVVASRIAPHPIFGPIDKIKSTKSYNKTSTTRSFTSE